MVTFTVSIYGGVPARVHYAVCEPTVNYPCTPDSPVRCCDAFGNFLTTAFSCLFPFKGSQKTEIGYCKAGDCARHVCKRSRKTIRSVKPSNLFCGASQSNPCKATCKLKSSDDCDDTAMFPDGGEHLEDGAICLKDHQKGVFRS